MRDSDVIIQDKKSTVKAKNVKKKEDTSVKAAKEKKKKKAQQKEDSLVPDKSPKDEEEEEETRAARKKEKKNKKKNEEPDDDHMETDINPANEPAVLDKDVKKRKRGAQNDTVVSEENSQPTKRIKKTREETQPEGPVNPTEKLSRPTDERVTRKKKPKGQKASPESTQISQRDGVVEKRRKKRRNNTGFPDPEDDTDLTHQATKALLYAFSQFHEPDSWKFKKAKQNWLIRNFWSTESIPEKYEDLVIKYLSATQGNSRDTLIKTCRTIIDDAHAKSVEDNKSQGTNAPSNLGGTLVDVAVSPVKPSEADRKKERAQVLLQVLESGADQ